MDRLYTVHLTDVKASEGEKLEFDTNVTVSIISVLQTLRAAGLIEFGEVSVTVASNQVPRLRPNHEATETDETLTGNPHP